VNKTINCQLDLQISKSVGDQQKNIPKETTIRTWIERSLQAQSKKAITSAEISIRIVDEKESAKYNLEYRQKSTATNILSFPADIPEIIKNPLLGDLLICASIIETEAAQQNKTIEAHWAHMIVHGTLHLMDYDHIKDKQAEEMEALEIEILSLLGFSNPYLQS
jgi:probable rRNA maturation factor